MELVELVTVYGPLGLGWVLYIQERKSHDRTREKVLDAFVGESEAKGKVFNAIDQLSTLIKAKLA